MTARWSPLLIAAGMVALTFAITALARTISASQGFFIERDVAVATLVVGLAASTIAYGIACRRILRRGGRADAIALRITALIMLLPVLLAILLPQHPAP